VQHTGRQRLGQVAHQDVGIQRMAQDGEVQSRCPDGLLCRVVHEAAVLDECRLGIDEAGIDHMAHPGIARGLQCVEILPQAHVVGIVGGDEQRLVRTPQRIAHQVGIAEVSVAHAHAAACELTGEL
jgi:hypothetical protein